MKSKKFKYRHDFNKNNAKMTNNNSSEDYYDWLGRDLTRSIFSALVDFSHHGDRKSSSFPGVIFYPALAAEWKMKNLKVKKSPLAVVDQRRRFVGLERPPNTPRKRTSAPSSLTMIPGKGKSWGASLIHTNRRRRRGAIPFAVDCTKSQWSNACWF